MDSVFLRRGRRQSLYQPNERRNAGDLSFRQSLVPLALVTSLFFLWGVAHGLLDTLNQNFQVTLGISRAGSSGLQAAYFGAYPLASLGYGNWILRRYGYKATFMTGLTLYGIGAILMWPATQYRSFPAICCTTFVIGSGLGTLELAANPFMAVCGPQKHSAIRVNLGQAVQATGLISGPLVSAYAFFNHERRVSVSLLNVQFVYLGIGAFVFCLDALIFVCRIPEITDADTELQAEESCLQSSSDVPFFKQYRLFHASFAQWCYTGAQVAISCYFINYVVEIRPNTSNALAAKFLAVAQACFALGRFLGSILMNFVKPRIVLFFFASAVIVFVSLSTTSQYNSGLAMVILTIFFESVVFPTILALGMKGLGRHTKRGAGLIVAGISGGAVAAADYKGMTFAMIVPAIFMIVPWSYAFCINCVPAYRDVIDSAPEKEPRPQSRLDEEAGGSPTPSRDTFASETPMINLNKPLPEVSKFEHIDTTDATNKERR